MVALHRGFLGPVFQLYRRLIRTNRRHGSKQSMLSVYISGPRDKNLRRPIYTLELGTTMHYSLLVQTVHQAGISWLLEACVADASSNLKTKTSS